MSKTPRGLSARRIKSRKTKDIKPPNFPLRVQEPLQSPPTPKTPDPIRELPSLDGAAWTRFPTLTKLPALKRRRGDGSGDGEQEKKRTKSKKKRKHNKDAKRDKKEYRQKSSRAGV